MVSITGKPVRLATLRYLNQPRPLRVLVDANQNPRMVVLSGRACRIRKIRDRWRVDDLWWREPLCRMYYELELQDGRITILFHDCLANQWYAQPYQT